MTIETAEIRRDANAHGICFGWSLAAAVLGGVRRVAPRLSAENVDLSTVPERDTVQLTIYNSAKT